MPSTINIYQERPLANEPDAPQTNPSALHRLTHDEMIPATNPQCGSPNLTEIADKLKVYFPDNDIEKPIFDSSSESFPTAAEPSVEGFQGSSVEKDRKLKHKKPLRFLTPEGNNNLSRRRNKKLWDGRLEEVNTSQSPFIHAVLEPPANLNPKREFIISFLVRFFNNIT